MDYFALLNEPRRPWLDPESLKQKFISRSAQVHPDRVHQLGDAERAAADLQYKDLNTAYHCLREPRDRLRHLIELERGTRPGELQEVPAQLADICMEVGQLCRAADRFQAELAQVSSPLLRVQRFTEGQEYVEKLMALQSQIADRQQKALAELRDLDKNWDDPTGRVRILLILEGLYRLLGFLLRWSAQIQERIVRFAL